jgi:hypothetical protein
VQDSATSLGEEIFWYSASMQFSISPMDCGLARVGIARRMQSHGAGYALKVPFHE